MQVGGRPGDHWVLGSVLQIAGGRRATLRPHTSVRSLLPAYPSARPSETNRSPTHTLSGAGGDAVHLMYVWTQSPNVLTEQILRTRTGKSVLQITHLVWLYKSHLFRAPQRVHHSHPPGSAQMN